MSSACLFPALNSILRSRPAFSPLCNPRRSTLRLRVQKRLRPWPEPQSTVKGWKHTFTGSTSFNPDWRSYDLRHRSSSYAPTSRKWLRRYIRLFANLDAAGVACCIGRLRRQNLNTADCDAPKYQKSDAKSRKAG